MPPGNSPKRGCWSNEARSKLAGMLPSARRRCISVFMPTSVLVVCYGRICAARSNARSVTARSTGEARFRTASPLRVVQLSSRPRSRIGDWEADTAIGKNHKQVIVSIVERKTGFTLIHKVGRKTAQVVSQAMIALLKPYRKKIHTITLDNEREFAGHEKIAKRLKANFYFAHPYSSWEQGTNENTNGLIRQYFPKNRDFTTITQQEIDMAMFKLNNRPRKRLKYNTPSQVFFKSGVALQT